MNLQQYQREWFGNVPRDLLSGVVVALALIPEAIAFSIIAGVDPQVGLYSSFCIAVVIAFTGGRPGMISAATGAMALLMITLVKNHGLEYLLLATVATGVVQIICGWLKLGDMLRFVSSSVMIGFVNALAILIFLAQLTEFRGQGPLMVGMVAGGLAIIYILPRFVRSVPSPLVCIVVLTALSLLLGLDLRTVGDMGALPSTFPIFALPQVPWNLETLLIIAPTVAALTVVGLLESLLTASIVDDLTDTDSNKNRECMGQGTANIVAGFFGAMAGCAMIGQTVINVKSGGRGRLSSFAAGIYLLAMILLLADWVKVIPMAALVAVMIMVAIGTFNWGSLKKLRTNPKMASLIMITTVVVTVLSHNLAIGVGVGAILSAFSFACKAARLVRIGTEAGEDGRSRSYFVEGNLFFVSVSAFTRAFDFREVLERATIDLTRAHFWDISSIAALDKVVLKFRRNGTEVSVIGLNEASATLVDRFAIHDKSGAENATTSLH